MTTPVSPRRTRPANATRHPGLVLLEGQKKQCTKAQATEDKSCALEAQAAKEAALQREIDRIAGIEAAMQVEQVAEATSRAKPVKPRARPVKKKEKQQDETNELTLEHPSIPPAQAKAQGAGGQHLVDSVGGGNNKVVENEEAGNEEVKMMKKKKKVNTVSREAISVAARQINLVRGKADNDKKGNLNPSAIHLLTTMLLMLTESTLCFMTLTWGLRSKKYSLMGKVNNWRTHLEPELKAAAKPSPAPSVHTATVSVDSGYFDPPLSLTDSSETSHAPALDEDGDDDNDIDTDDEEDNDNEFKEHFVANVKGKAQERMQSVVAISGEIAEHSDNNGSEILPVSMPFNLLPFTQQAEIVQFALEQAKPTRTGSSSKRPIEAVDLITLSEEDSDVADEYMSQTPRSNPHFNPITPPIPLASTTRVTHVEDGDEEVFYDCD
ncbi:hypothetical protein P692DRAFT_20882136 [Suillus brevipes Sb2]|nr:hypothetical protein P692DRAFT_20882136 [Suillus brevipes Sb2]